MIKRILDMILSHQQTEKELRHALQVLKDRAEGLEVQNQNLNQTVSRIRREAVNGCCQRCRPSK